MEKAMLEVHHLNSGYGVVQVLWDITIEVIQGEITALIGSNGVGKTTLMRTLAGNIPPMGGQIFYRGQEMTHLPQPSGFGTNSIVPKGRALSGTEGNLR
jgi:branched-chain amino acid transport system ATP-binding protein